MMEWDNLIVHDGTAKECYDDFYKRKGRRVSHRNISPNDEKLKAFWFWHEEECYLIVYFGDINKQVALSLIRHKLNDILVDERVKVA